MIATLIHQPKLIILDEPFSGLDPVNVDLMKQLILEEKRKGATIIFSDHDMRNVEELCDDVVMINDGHIVLNGPVNEIKSSFGLTRIFVRTDKNATELSALPGVKDIILQNNGMKLLILEEHRTGAAIILSDHEQRQGEELCDDVVMSNEGQLVVKGPVNERFSR